MRGGVRRVRGAIGARLDLHRARSEAAARALELRPLIDGLALEVDALRSEVRELRAAQPNAVAEVLAHSPELGRLEASLLRLEASLVRQERLGRVHYDDLGTLRTGLSALRATDAYAAAFTSSEPLVSVPIATFDAADLLIGRAIASVRAQTYGNWEIVVVGDGCTDDTEQRLDTLGDPRIRFVNLPFRTLDVEDAHERWLVSGSAPQNHAVELSRGTWLAPLDDDDEFLPDHIEVLLGLARERLAELAYGKIVQPDGTEHFSVPPALGQIGMQATLYLRALASVFQWDTCSWVLDEPADWNLIRRMREAGVRMAATEAPVTRYYPSLSERV